MSVRQQVRSVTHFEYVSAGYILMLTFAAARLLAGAADVVAPRRFYWVHASWTALAVMFCLAAFWAFWAYREVEWTLPRMIVLLATPALLYVFSSVLVPSDPSDVSSWREYFFKMRVPIFASGVLLVLSINLGNQSLLGVPPFHSSQIGLYSCLAIFSDGALSRREKMHSILALAPPLLIAWVLIDLALPDWYSQ